MNEYGLMFPIILEKVLDPTVPEFLADGSPNPAYPVYLLNADGDPIQGPAKPGLEDSIESSLRIIIAYDLGERNFLFAFGTILRTLLGEPNAQPAANAISLFVGKAIEKWEPRLAYTSVEVEQLDEIISLEIIGEIKDVQKKFNYQIIA